MKEDKKNIIGWEDVVKAQPPAYKKWFKAEKQYLIKNIKKNSSVLEVGCGDGRSLKDMLNVTKNLTGIDHDKTAVKHAKANLKNYPGVKIILADGKNLPFQGKHFDYVTCIGTFANFAKDKFIILKEMIRVLKDDGYIIITVYADNALKDRLKAYEKAELKIKKVKLNGTVIFDDFGADGISEQFSKKQLTDIANKVGLKVVDINRVSIAYFCKLKKK